MIREGWTRGTNRFASAVQANDDDRELFFPTIVLSKQYEANAENLPGQIFVKAFQKVVHLALFIEPRTHVSDATDDAPLNQTMLQTSPSAPAPPRQFRFVCLRPQHGPLQLLRLRAPFIRRRRNRSIPSLHWYVSYYSFTLRCRTQGSLRRVLLRQTLEKHLMSEGSWRSQVLMHGLALVSGCASGLVCWVPDGMSPHLYVICYGAERTFGDGLAGVSS